MRPDSFADRLLHESLEPLAAIAAPALAPTRFAPRPALLPPVSVPLEREVRQPPPAREPSLLRGPIVATVVGSWATVLAVLGACALLGCNGPRTIHERPVLVTGERVPAPDAGAQAARVASAQQRQRDARDSAFAAAGAACAPATCDALARGELAIGMTEGEVRVATRSASDAWSVRDAGGTTVMVAASLATPPSDAVGEVAMVQLRAGRVASVSYREPQGVRVVQSAADATTEGRARAMGEAFVREGDAFVAAGNHAAALDRYDRAVVLLPNDAMLQYRIATMLDLELRPIEALIRYQRFLHQLDLERIDAIGDANAKLGDAIARAQQRIVILERQRR